MDRHTFSYVDNGAIANPGYYQSRGGLCGPGTYLYAGNKVSSTTGLPNLTTDSVVIAARAEAKESATYDVTLSYHYGNQVGETDVGTISITPTTRRFTLDWTGIPDDAQLAMRISAGSVRDPGVSFVINGGTQT